MSKRELFDCSLAFIRETKLAILVSEDGKIEIWLPKSQIEYDLRENNSVEVTMPLWLASEKKLAGA